MSTCCDWLLHNLSVENAFYVRDLAIEFRQTQMLDAVQEFILDHFEGVSRGIWMGVVDIGHDV